jgi:hypothetical protein
MDTDKQIISKLSSSIGDIINILNGYKEISVRLIIIYILYLCNFNHIFNIILLILSSIQIIGFIYCTLWLVVYVKEIKKLNKK